MEWSGSIVWYIVVEKVAGDLVAEATKDGQGTSGGSDGFLTRASLKESSTARMDGEGRESEWRAGEPCR
jgi:hypothetical protein